VGGIEIAAGLVVAVAAVGRRTSGEEAAERRLRLRRAAA
jgi:hypothetical protein